MVTGEHSIASLEESTDMTRRYYGIMGIRRGLVHFLIGKSSSAVLGFTAAVLLVRVMSIREYATYAALLGLQMVIIVMASLGFDRFVTRYLPEMRQQCSEGELKAYVFCLMGIRGVALLVVAALVLVYQELLFSLFDFGSDREALIAAVAYMVVLGISQLALRSQQALMLQRAAKWAQIAEAALRLLAVVVVAYLLNELVSAAVAIWINLAAILASLTISLCNLYFRLPPAQVDGDSNPEPSDMMRFGMQNYVQSVLLLPMDPPSLRLLAAAVLAPSAIAAYGFFQTITGVFRRYLPVQLLLDLTEPVLFARYSESKDFKALNFSTNLLLKINLALILPVAGWIFICGATIVPVITNGKYGEFAWLLGILIVGLVYESHWIVLRTVINADRQSGLLVSGAAESCLLFAIL
ncbi:MAG: lipopolysaccharide biosynthesis protein, partial [Methylococcales bacterium]